jgi:hypothetical protein
MGCTRKKAELRKGSSAFKFPLLGSALIPRHIRPYYPNIMPIRKSFGKRYNLIGVLLSTPLRSEVFKLV